MDLEELRGFLAVVETGSFLSAATTLGVPRGTLRRRIDTLEARVGVPLLERSARGVTITEAGGLLARHGRRLIEEGAALLAATREVGREPSGELRVHVPVGLPPPALVAAIELARVAVPKLRLSICVREDPLAGPLDEVDIALHFGEHRKLGARVGHELLRVPVRALASPGYLDRRGRPGSVAALRDHALASWTGAGSDPRRWPLRDGGSVELEPMLVSNDPHVLRHHARAGVAIALIPDADLGPFGLGVDELVPVLEDLVGGHVGLSLSLPAAIGGRSKIARVVTLLRGLLSRSWT
jgi:DNA-binding transcriptional LysR family regulator